MIQPHHTLLAQASKWLLRMKNAAPDHADRSKFEAWLMSSTAHQEAYQIIAETWEDFDSAGQVKELSKAISVKKLEDDMRKRHKATQLAKLGVCVMLCLSMMLGWHAWQGWYRQPIETIAQASAPGQLVTHYLSDGSKLILDAHSKTQVVYYRDKRYVKLLQGQAVFEVVKDVERPFVVESSHAKITVKGTRFLVNMVAGKTVVAVDHGKVLVESLATNPSTIVKLTNNQVVEVFPHSSPLVIHKSAIDAFSFLQGKLIFDGASMSEVTETLSRYREPAIVNQSTSRKPISAVVNIATINTFIKALPAVAGVKMKESSTQTVFVDP